MIKKTKEGYTLYSRNGKRKLFSSPSYQACLNREAEIKKIIAAKTNQKQQK